MSSLHFSDNPSLPLFFVYWVDEKKKQKQKTQQNKNKTNKQKNTLLAHFRDAQK